MAHYYDSKPIAQSKPKEISFRMKGIDYNFITDNGVFSKTQLDFGTNLLLETAIKELSAKDKKDLSVLDLGCGYGPVGIVLKRSFPPISVSMIDINERAVLLAKENASKNLVKYLNIFISNGFENITDKYDVVLTNPPIRAGKKTVFEFYEGSYDHLNDQGVLYVVIQKKQGAPSSFDKLMELFGNCDVIEKEGGYWILKAVKSVK